MRARKVISTGIAATLVLALSLPLAAAPPGHAPAHGYRAKNRAEPAPTVHVGYSGSSWDLDYGVLSGNCDRQKIATVVGGVTGGFIANRVAESDNRTVATIIGAAAGALIGNRIGKRLDQADEACVGHALEIGKAGQPVSWTNDSTGVAYQLVPGAASVRNGSPCRDFSLRAIADSQGSTRQGVACRSDVGVWQITQ